VNEVLVPTPTSTAKMNLISNAITDRIEISNAVTDRIEGRLGACAR
jgi:hypothetical protein